MSNKKQAILAITVFLPAIGLAAVPTAFMENSQVIATGQKIQVFRAPTRDINGVIKYYDVTITLNVKDNGTIDPIATGVPAVNASSIVAASSPILQSIKFIPGTYKNSTSTVTCNVTVTNLIGGRTQAAISCINAPTGFFTGNWVTGAIPGHPYQLDLQKASIDLIPGYKDFAWGKIGSSDNSSWFNCMKPSEIISATQVGNAIQLSGYDLSNIQMCGTTLTKQ